MDVKGGLRDSDAKGQGAVVGAASSTGQGACTASPSASEGDEVKRGINMSKLAALRAKKRGQYPATFESFTAR